MRVIEHSPGTFGGGPQNSSVVAIYVGGGCVASEVNLDHLIKLSRGPLAAHPVSLLGLAVYRDICHMSRGFLTNGVTSQVLIVIRHAIYRT